jgi:hypothetical protein
LEIERNRVTKRNIELRDGERLRSIRVTKKIGRDEERASERAKATMIQVMTAVTTKRKRITTAVRTESDRRVTVAE